MKITKKEFKKLHSDNKLLLIAGGVKKDISFILNRLQEVETIPEGEKTTTCNVENYRDISTVKIFKSVIKKSTLFIVQTIIDNSKDEDCSWSSVDEYNTIYSLSE